MLFRSISGTTAWTPIEAVVPVPPHTRVVSIRVFRQRSLKFDSFIAGTAWVDDVSLTRLR